MAKQSSRRSDFKLSYIQLIVLAGFCLGCMAASYWLGFYTGTRAGYETAVTSDLAASSKIPINAASPRDNYAQPANDVYAKLDGTSPMSPGNTPVAKNTGAPEIAAIPKLEVSPRPGEGDIDAELAETLLSPENKDHQKPADTKSAAEGVWSLHPGTAGAGGESPEKTLGGAKKEQLPEAAQSVSEKVPPAVTPVPVKTVEKTALQEMVKTTPTPAADRERQKEKEKDKEKLLKEKEAEKIPAAEAAPTPASGSKITKGWYAQVAAPKELKDAEALAGRLKRSGFPVVVEQAKVRGETYYRILVGPESGQETASRLVGQLKRESYLEGEPFIRMAK